MSLVQPCIDYCIVSWYMGLSKGLRDRLEVLQRKMVRYVFGWGPRSHVGVGALKELGWLLIADRVRYFAVLHAFRIRKGLAPPNLSRGFVQVSGVHGHETRGSSLNFHLSRDDIPGSFAHFGKVQWNDLPDALKSIDREGFFLVKLKAFLTRDY